MNEADIIALTVVIFLIIGGIVAFFVFKTRVSSTQDQDPLPPAQDQDQDPLPPAQDQDQDQDQNQGSLFPTQTQNQNQYLLSPNPKLREVQLVAVIQRLQLKNASLEALLPQLDELKKTNIVLVEQLQEYKAKNADVELLLKQKHELEEHLKFITTTAVTQTQEQDYLIAQKKQEMQEVAAQYAALCEQLAGAQATNRAVLKAKDLENEGTWEIKVAAPKEKLRELLEEVAVHYPEIASDMLKLEWQKCWMPVLQDIRRRGELDQVSGIYRLVLKEDQRVCYVGQATDLGERWMTHCKKMIGAEKKGNEKLYEYTPDQFEWTVLEKNVPVAMLDGKERYWIDFYKAAEIGLNSKRGV